MAYINRLALESSPYLQQHAHNPVDWYPWGEEALQKARAEDKPILVSIGYAACHWCHVMERESFEDPATAEIMNRHFVNIKIDREERPDLDHIYMDAVQAMSGSGGWPLNVFLTPDARPFYGGTYFPPVRAFNRASWKEVLHRIAEAFRDKRADIEDQARQLTTHLEQSNAFGLSSPNAIDLPVEEKFTRSQLQLARDNIMKQADRQWGGFSRAPKFPQTFSIQYLLRYDRAYSDSEALGQALLSLDKMIMGGIYDQVGGGFARYSTDTEWLAPHFEKMTYDNALLISVLSEAFQHTGDPVYAQVIRETIAFMLREMSLEGKGFYAALDADSEGVEGKFYTWTHAEAAAILGDDFALLAEAWDIRPEGNWEHRTILHLREKLPALSRRLGMPEARVEEAIARGKAKLLQARARRVRPSLDDKTLLGWNAMMVNGLAKAAAALGDAQYAQLAQQNMDFLLEVFARTDAPGYWHTWKSGNARIPAFLDDYACLAEALIALQEITGEGKYLEKASQLVEYVMDHFTEAEGPFFYYTGREQTDVIVRKKEVYDGAVPSGNALMAWNLHRLGILLERPDWNLRSDRMLDAMAPVLSRYPNSFGVWANLLLERVQGTMEVAIVGKTAGENAAEFLKLFIPHRVLQFSRMANDQFPLLRGRPAGEDADWYLCRDYACLHPVKTLSEMLQLMEKERESSKPAIQ